MLHLAPPGDAHAKFRSTWPNQKVIYPFTAERSSVNSLISVRHLYGCSLVLIEINYGEMIDKAHTCTARHYVPDEGPIVFRLVSKYLFSQTSHKFTYIR